MMIRPDCLFVDSQRPNRLWGQYMPAVPVKFSWWVCRLCLLKSQHTFLSGDEYRGCDNSLIYVASGPVLKMFRLQRHTGYSSTVVLSQRNIHTQSQVTSLSILYTEILCVCADCRVRAMGCGRVPNPTRCPLGALCHLRLVYAEPGFLEPGLR